jgi:hypothetical protein
VNELFFFGWIIDIIDGVMVMLWNCCLFFCEEFSFGELLRNDEMPEMNDEWRYLDVQSEITENFTYKSQA